MTDIIVRLVHVPWCESPVRNMKKEQAEADKEILKMMYMENLIPVCVSYQGVTKYYTVDLFGELVEVQS